MPARFHPLSPAIWDRKFRNLCDHAKIVALYTWTCRARCSEGLFKLPLAYVIGETNLTEDEVLAAFKELEAAGLVEYDEESETVLDGVALKFNPISHQDNRLRGALKQLEQLTDSPLLAKFAQLASRFSPDFALQIYEKYPWLETPSGKALQSPSEAPLEPRVDKSSYEESRVESSSGKPEQDQSFRTHEKEVQEVYANLGGEVVSFRGVPR